MLFLGPSRWRPFGLTDEDSQVCTVEIDGQEGIKSERVTNFLTVPKELEKVTKLISELSYLFPTQEEADSNLESSS